MSVLHILHLDYNFLCWFIKNTFSCYHCYTHTLISLSVFSKGLNTRNVQLTLHKHSKVYTSMKSNLSILCRISWARLTEIRIYNFRFHHYRKWMFVSWNWNINAKIALLLFDFSELTFVRFTCSCFKLQSASQFSCKIFKMKMATVGFLNEKHYLI